MAETPENRANLRQRGQIAGAVRTTARAIRAATALGATPDALARLRSRQARQEATARLLSSDRNFGPIASRARVAAGTAGQVRTRRRTGSDAARVARQVGGTVVALPTPRRARAAAPAIAVVAPAPKARKPRAPKAAGTTPKKPRKPRAKKAT